ncbi:ferritin-like domain-containing protein [Dyadobacter psychrotolerans]|uniref:Ferritin-like domain-containing protein n=1 Tax=Dyadobacter psychrotolerans TaxID=2541721 RepID=A0A4R5DL85_9BACT|nr:ferritin-like domain-containing protein [Dyadobacter psychrotolerans]TDE12741.1 ferritin-like domain-containing protein [Dyadobacter psychrotolerans]
MDIFKIIDELTKIDGDAVGRIEHASRRHFMNRVSSKLATVAAPMVFGTILNKAYAQSAAAVDVLKFALTLEYLEDAFYKEGIKAGKIPAQYLTSITQISKHEAQHVAYLEAAVGKMTLSYDWTYGGKLTDTFTNFSTFITVACALEDTGVRAYKGQAGALMMDPAILKVALQVHSVEARHAAQVRRIFAVVNSSAATKGWITGNQSPIPLVQAVYDGEENLTQGGVNLKGLAGKSDAAISEAFDETLPKATVLAIAGPFFK